MTMAIIPAQTGRISGIFWRRPALGLFLLLLGPLMWFGIVYLGSLLTLLWQSIYTFDDFTMSVTSDFTLANLRALFNPANYDIIVRTLVMALCVTLASALLALPMAWYMARYTSGKMKAFFYIAVMLPMWASYIVKAYAWVLLLAKDGVAQWFLGHLGLEGALNALLSVPAVGGNTLSTSGLGRFLVFVYIWLAVYDPAGAGGAGAYSGIVATGLGRSRRGPAADLSLRGAAAGHSRHRRWVDLHLFADARRLLSCRSWWARRDTLSAIWFTRSRGRSAICRWRRRLP
ncbi:Spermidine Putrescine ABC transporter permease PotB [Klebsiella pneumoniae subsp. ozaenae]|uniref:Spermidine Putrescine ABC transporter permease PotB n=1 Tax=Klebsiella pneumoniae subsp. ozaenae TaxID=574 RepID=A0A378B4A4_KLEPO|nr:Spermidine Putrescine ABC transporter permease PotB [Klebsiella pneumoniae subsp. ozaenae]